MVLLYLDVCKGIGKTGRAPEADQDGVVAPGQQHLGVLRLLPHQLILVQPKQPQGCLDAEAPTTTLHVTRWQLVEQVSRSSVLVCRQHGV